VTRDELTLGAVDADGAICETVGRIAGDSRADFLRTTAIGGAVLLGALARPALADAAGRRDNDILNFALALEYLQAAFYTETERMGALGGRAEEATRVVGAVERAHVQALRKVLGRAAVRRPRFNFRGTTEDERAFLKTAVAFEDLAVAAYKGQAPRIRSPEILAAAVAIHSVEARHAAWMRRLYGIVPVDDAFDEPVSQRAALRTVASTRFIAKSRTTARHKRPKLTG
jgi:hypothetical protein